MTRDEIKEMILEKNREMLRTLDWGEINNSEQGKTILDAFCHTLTGAIVGNVTFRNRPSPERLESMKEEIHFNLIERAHELMRMLAQEEGTKN